MARRISRETDDMCARVYQEISAARINREIGNVVFAFPWVKQEGNWVEPSPLILAAITKRAELGKPIKKGAFPIHLCNVEDVEFPFSHGWMKKFRSVGCLVVERFSRGSTLVTRVKVPSEYVRRNALQSALVSVPQFHLGMTWYWPTIDALETVCRDNNQVRQVRKQ